MEKKLSSNLDPSADQLKRYQTLFENFLEYLETNFPGWAEIPLTGVQPYAAMKALKGKDKQDFVFYLIERAIKLKGQYKSSKETDEEAKKYRLYFYIFESLMKTRIDFEEKAFLKV